jgi:hypothetical protein
MVAGSLINLALFLQNDVAAVLVGLRLTTVA